MTDYDTLETLIQIGGHRLSVNPSSSHFSTSNNQSLEQRLTVLMSSGTRHVLSEVGFVGTLRSLCSIQRVRVRGGQVGKPLLATNRLLKCRKRKLVLLDPLSIQEKSNSEILCVIWIFSVGNWSVCGPNEAAGGAWPSSVSLWWLIQNHRGTRGTTWV